MIISIQRTPAVRMMIGSQFIKNDMVFTVTSIWFDTDEEDGDIAARDQDRNEHCFSFGEGECFAMVVSDEP